MPDVERTAAGLQVVIAGCELLTLPKPTTATPARACYIPHLMQQMGQTVLNIWF
jgi:hypothetical protein